MVIVRSFCRSPMIEDDGDRTTDYRAPLVACKIMLSNCSSNFSLAELNVLRVNVSVSAVDDGFVNPGISILKNPLTDDLTTAST